MRLKLLIIVALSLLVTGASSPALADITAMSTYSWDSGLFATSSRYYDQAHAWGQRQTAGAWGTGPVNYQSGATINNPASASGTLDVVLNGTYCPGGVCSYGGGSGYKGLVQFWNDPNNYIAFGLIHDPGVSPSGMTLMIEGAGGGKPVGGYWPGGAITGVSHAFSFTWTATTISVTIDNQVTLGPYQVAQTNPSISFLAAGRQLGDNCDSTFTNISFSSGSVVAQPVTIPPGEPYFSYSATLTQSGSGTGYASYINSHDANSNAISIGIQSDSSSAQSKGQPYYIWELVQAGHFSYNYLAPAAGGAQTVSLKWWQGDDTAVFYVDGIAVADISVHLDPRLFFNVEGNARINGDSVNDTITNTQITVGNNCPTYCGLNGAWNTADFNFYGLMATQTNGATQNGANFSVTGTVTGLPPGGDWDSYLVAGIGMIAQYWNGL
ncbi:MAG: hypothetical protein Q7R60_03325 [bacterium]|nr:hypothetical protein [bacterium]